MQRYFVDTLDKHHIVFKDAQYHHIVRVMRMTAGDQVCAVLPNQQAVILQLDTIFENEVTTTFMADDTTHKELPIAVTIACGLSKGDKLEWVVQKATELGMASFQPFDSQFSVVKWDDKKADKKGDRLQKIAQESAEQSHRVVVPKVLPYCAFKDLVASVSQYTHVIVAYEESAKQSETSRLHQLCQQLKSGDRLLVVFGCEGGLSSKEVSQLEQAGAVICGLGPRILRAETAPMYVLSVLSYVLELQ